MSRRIRVAAGVLLVAAALAVPTIVAATPGSSATVAFGNADVGSSFPPAPPGVGHDQSPNAEFNLVPRTAVIADDGTVTFVIGGEPGHPHQVAVCAEGITPQEVDVPTSGPVVGDPDCPPLGSAATDGERMATFSDPGRYLVLCNIRGHFTFYDMYGWVEVK